MFKDKYLTDTLSREQLPNLFRELSALFLKDGTLYDLHMLKLRFIHLIDSWLSSLERYDLKSYLQQDALSAQKSITAQNRLDQVYETAYNLFCNLLASLEELNKNATGQLVRSCVSYIRDHYGESLSLSDMADRLYVSSTYLSKLFSTQMGQPFTRYLQEYRVKKAVELLQNTEYKVYAIAQMCGFSDVAYFSRAFKSVTGLSPQQYRNRKL